MSGEGVSLIEWANLIDEILPANRTEITIEKDLEQGFDFVGSGLTVKKEEWNNNMIQRTFYSNRQFGT